MNLLDQWMIRRVYRNDIDLCPCSSQGKGEFSFICFGVWFASIISCCNLSGLVWSRKFLSLCACLIQPVPARLTNYLRLYITLTHAHIQSALLDIWCSVHARSQREQQRALADWLKKMCKTRCVFDTRCVHYAGWLNIFAHSHIDASYSSTNTHAATTYTETVNWHASKPPPLANGLQRPRAPSRKM